MGSFFVSAVYNEVIDASGSHNGDTRMKAFLYDEQPEMSLCIFLGFDLYSMKSCSCIPFYMSQTSPSM